MTPSGIRRSFRTFSYFCKSLFLTTSSCPFYAFFWQMSLMDLEVPIASYESAITRLKKTADEIRTWKALPNGRFPRQADIIKEAKRFDDRIAELSKEREIQMSNVSGLYRKTLRQRSAKWFEGCKYSLDFSRRGSFSQTARCYLTSDAFLESSTNDAFSLALSCPLPILPMLPR